MSALADGVHGLIRDISEHEKLEKQLRESEAAYREVSKKLDSQVKRQLEQLRHAEALATIGRMISVVAHEIRNPVQNIQFGVESLSKMKMSESERSEVLAEIQWGADLLKHLVEDLLNYSKPVKLECSPHPIGDLVSQALKRAEYRLCNIDTHVELEREDRLIFVDPEKFTMVLVNLISNAVEAMPEQGRLTIQSRYHEDGGSGFVGLVISDNGCGIPEENLAKIYEPFFTTKERGTGLGIPICRKIVDVHNGRLIINSKRGEGTTIEITIPLAA
jgi:signal transduction histidine kinase